MAAIAPFGLRMQPDLKDHVDEAAKANNRSMNAEIIARLEKSFADASGTPDLSLPEALEAHGGDKCALLASETLRLRKLFERLERHNEVKPDKCPSSVTSEQNSRRLM